MIPWRAVGAATLTGVLAGAGAAYVAGRRVVNRSVADYAGHWSDQPGEHPAGLLNYVALGDSAAQGVGASAVDKGYVPLIADRLSQVTGRRVAITNLSVSGAISDDVVKDQLPALRALPFAPDLVTLDVGANDVLFRPHDVAAFAASLETIVAELPPESFVADVPWMVLPGFAGQSALMAKRAAELVQEHGHHLVQLHRHSRASGYLGYPRRTARDWFHPNDAGYQQWADAFWESIEASGVLERLAVGER